MSAIHQTIRQTKPRRGEENAPIARYEEFEFANKSAEIGKTPTILKVTWRAGNPREGEEMKASKQGHTYECGGDAKQARWAYDGCCSNQRAGIPARGCAHLMTVAPLPPDEQDGRIDGRYLVGVVELKEDLVSNYQLELLVLKTVSGSSSSSSQREVVTGDVWVTCHGTHPVPTCRLSLDFNHDSIFSVPVLKLPPPYGSGSASLLSLNATIIYKVFNQSLKLQMPTVNLYLSASVDLNGGSEHVVFKELRDDCTYLDGRTTLLQALVR
ncbi:hypothetical protein R3P38DRAFT_2786569 [Favolaschia claudopus]|uniref:Uncharacterized protein n=1 Tax=Favolaschia claudopus TaxID=2862362 RepID=A0AAW0ASX7_9AGAR